MRVSGDFDATLGPVSILVNNAGMTVVVVLDQAPGDWDKVIETNLNACFLLSKLAAQSMIKLCQGKIINIANMYSIFGSGSVPSYSAAKGALVQLTKSMMASRAKEPFNDSDWILAFTVRVRSHHGAT
jgi:NAD(P)-dependent dehydrogenase (short-subunit alcohol dehydrogenase family)